ncbi:hypothetical protein BCR35DRAFT_36969 [Leucosporidium creatinivorum]|uniref:Uncharacterized protein n=1 Tax=Leucosporidium creatinivorum TaxID=106004 RepID=A0A1Y2C892_9BASI|nr:hypothetical protein BCR35DRAFT_36969 [Leucosporidium creatinivorum]
MGLLDSELLRMEGQVWRHPTAHKAWVEAEKKKAEEAKKIKEAKKLEVAKEKEKTKMIRKQLKETGRLNDMKEAGQRLEKLRGDVAVLELKARGLTKEKATELADAERKVREAEQRNAVVGAEAATTAAEMLLKKEKELEQKKKDFEATQSMIAAQRRRELLEYKHQLGLPSSPTPFDHHRLRQRQTGAQPRYPRPNRSNTAIYDDPEFWKLSEEDQRLLEGLDWWEQERLGFGPYDGGLGGRGAGLGKGKGKGKGGLMGGGLSALEELEMGEEGDGHEVDEDGRRFGEPLYDPQHLPGFYCFSTTHPPPGLTILRVLGPLEASVLTAMPPPNAELGPEDRKLFRDELALDKAFAKSDLIEEALRNKANCLLGVKIEMVDRRDGTVSALPLPADRSRAEC